MLGLGLVMDVMAERALRDSDLEGVEGHSSGFVIVILIIYLLWLSCRSYVIVKMVI